MKPYTSQLFLKGELIMSLTQTTSKEELNAELNLITELEEKCKSCKYLTETFINHMRVFVYYDCLDYISEDGPAMMAYAKCGHTYAIYPAKYLKGELWAILEFFLRKLEPNDTIVVFSQETFNNLQERSSGKKFNVQLSV